MATGSRRLVEYYGVLCMWRLVWFWCRKMSHTQKQRRSARQRGRREREEYLRAGPSILSRFLSIFNILMLWASQRTVGDRGGDRQTDRQTDRQKNSVLFHLSVWPSSVVPSQRIVDGLTMDRRIQFFLTYLSGRRVSSSSFRRQTLTPSGNNPLLTLTAFKPR